MSALLSRLLRFLFPKQEYRVLLFGLPLSGKTRAVNSLLGAEVSRLTQTIGLKVESVDVSGSELVIWEFGATPVMRQVWREYLPHSDGLVFFVDGSDPDSIEDMTGQWDAWQSARGLLTDFLQQSDLAGLPIAIAVSKQDLPGCISVANVTTGLGMAEIKDCRWKVFPVWETGEGKMRGITDVMQWLLGEMEAARKTHSSVLSLIRQREIPQPH